MAILRLSDVAYSSQYSLFLKSSFIDPALAVRKHLSVGVLLGLAFVQLTLFCVGNRTLCSRVQSVRPCQVGGFRHSEQSVKQLSPVNTSAALAQDGNDTGRNTTVTFHDETSWSRHATLRCSLCIALHCVARQRLLILTLLVA